MYDAHWLRIYRRLAYFKDSLPNGVVALQETYVRQYHSLLGELEHLSGLDLQSYEISESDLYTVSVTPVDTDQPILSPLRFIDTDYMLEKFQTLSGLFDRAFAEL